MAESDQPSPSRNDPTPEQRKGDARFLPVVIAAGIAIILILLAAIIFLKAKPEKAIPKANPTSRLTQPAAPTIRPQADLWI
jgi:hypothetical protein